MTQELTEKIKELEQEITKWKFKYNAKNADYILLYHELERYKKSNMNKWIIIGGIALVVALVYYYSRPEKEVFYDAQEEL